MTDIIGHPADYDPRQGCHDRETHEPPPAELAFRHLPQGWKKPEELPPWIDLFTVVTAAPCGTR